MRKIVVTTTMIGGVLVHGCSSSSPSSTQGSAPHMLYVAHDGVLVSYDLETGKELAGAVQNVTKRWTCRRSRTERSSST
jgi:hypothetical protein